MALLVARSHFGMLELPLELEVGVIHSQLNRSLGVSAKGAAARRGPRRCVCWNAAPRLHHENAAKG